MNRHKCLFQRIQPPKKTNNKHTYEIDIKNFQGNFIPTNHESH